VAFSICFYPFIWLLLRALAGSRPGGRGTFLCFAKEKYPKERRAECVAGTVCRFAALLGLGGVPLKLAALRQSRPLISPAQPCATRRRTTAVDARVSLPPSVCA